MEQIVVEDQILGKDHLKCISFPKLKKIEVINCDKLRSLLPISIAYGLPQLRELHVERAYQLHEVFEHEVVSAVKEIELPSLWDLFLIELTTLISFCPGNYHLVFPKLYYNLEENKCPKLRTRITTDSEGT